MEGRESIDDELELMFPDNEVKLANAVALSEGTTQGNQMYFSTNEVGGGRDFNEEEAILPNFAPACNEKKKGNHRYVSID